MKENWTVCSLPSFRYMNVAVKVGPCTVRLLPIRNNIRNNTDRRQRSRGVSTVQIICSSGSATRNGFPLIKIIFKQKVCATDPIKPSEDVTFSNTKAIPCPLGNKASRPTSSKKKNKKGGLSLFLSGALDDTPKPTPPTPVVLVTPKQEGPAWGGAKISKGPASLRDIQSEQKSKTSDLMTTKTKDRHEDSPDSAGRLRLSSFMPDACSSPISVTSARAVPAHEGDKSTPPWSSSATSPNISRPSLRDIQMQQEKRHQGIVSHSPKTRTSGFAIPSQGAVAEVGGVRDNIPNRWFKPEGDATSSIRSIQIEEQAMKDFKRFYTSVRIMKPQV